MLTYVISRAVQFALSLIVASAVVFALMSILPGNAAQVALGTNSTPEAVAALEAQYGLDQPPLIRYLDWMRGMLGGDFGTVDAMGRMIFSEGIVPFEVSSALLMVAIVGAVAVARGKQGHELTPAAATEAAVPAPASRETAEKHS